MAGRIISVLLICVFVQSTELMRIDTPPEIDGMADAVWERCTEMAGKYTEVMPEFGKLIDDSASMKMCYDKDNIYLLIDAKQDPSTFVEVNAVRDKGWLQDQIGIVIDPMGNGAEEFYIVFGLAGNIMDMRKMRKISDMEDGTWDCDVEYKVRKYDQGYIVEAKIPFKNFKISAGKEVKWGINFYRRVFHTNSQSFFNAISALNDDAEYDALMPVTMKDIGAGIKMDITPYGVYGAVVDSSIDDYGNAGIDAKININSSSVLNFAFNPDYSQLEGDPLIFEVNNHYARYCSEYRPFFVEETGVFKTSDRINYTRSTVNPYIAGKYTYKDPENQIGIISAFDKEDVNVGNEDALVNMIRYSRQFGNNSLGAMLMNRYTIDDDVDNSVIMVDGGFFPNSDLRITTLVAANIKADFSNTDSPIFINEESGYTYDGGLIYADQNWIFAFQTEGVSGDFNNEMGYETYNDLNVFANYSAKRFFINNKIFKYVELGETFIFAYPWTGLKKYLDNPTENIQYSICPEIKTRLFNGADIRLNWKYENEVYSGYYFNSMSGNFYANSRINSYLRFDFSGRTGQQIDYNYARLGWSDVAVYNIYYTLAEFLSLNTGAAYSYFKSDSSGNARNSSEIDEYGFRWKGFTVDGGITYSPGNTVSLKLIGELQFIDYAEGYCEDGTMHEQKKTLFFITEYKPSVGNVVYLGGRYPDNTIFFKFTTRISV